ncbi:hypothetical protein C5167_009289, partial [Papaver somniferum]
AKCFSFWYIVLVAARAGNPSQNPRVGPSRPVKTRARPGSMSSVQEQELPEPDHFKDVMSADDEDDDVEML